MLLSQAEGNNRADFSKISNILLRPILLLKTILPIL